MPDDAPELGRTVDARGIAAHRRDRDGSLG
jgi:hypothetical protein